MLRILSYLVVVAVFSSGVGGDAAFAQKKAKKKRRNNKQAFLDAKSAGPDFAVQGEYTGTIGNGTKFGAQVIALGDGKFDAVLFAGGLPGAGWNGKVHVKLNGKTTGKRTILSGRNFKGVIANGVFEGTAEEDVEFRLKKIARKSPTLGAKPPPGAIVLFDGSNIKQWEKGKLEDGKLLGVGSRTKKKFLDFTLHLEFRTPFMPFARGQGRGDRPRRGRQRSEAIGGPYRTAGRALF